VLLVLTAGLVRAAGPTVTPLPTIGPPPATTSFDISFVKNDIGKYILADRGAAVNPPTITSNGAVDLFDAKALTFTGGIGGASVSPPVGSGFVGNHAACAVFRGCSGPNGVLIDSHNVVWAADGPASACSTQECFCFPGETHSMVKAYTLAVSTGATGRLACLDTGGNFRADEMAFDPRDDLLLVANDDDGFLSLINTSGTPAIVDRFFYADNDFGPPPHAPASVPGLSTAGGGIEQPVWNPQQGFFYLAIPQGTSVGRVDVFNPKPGKLVFLRSIQVPGCNGGPSGLAINTDRELLGACDNGAALIDANSGRVSIIGSAMNNFLGGADEIWFDPGSNAWYLAISPPMTPPGQPGKVGIVSAADHTVQVATHTPPPCCGHSVAAYTASASESFIFSPNAGGTGISVFRATP
jgi:hypothetical protein